MRYAQYVRKGGFIKTYKDFELFKGEFKKWQKQFGLTGYKVYFKYKPDDGYFASLTVNQGNEVATATLNSKLPDKDKPFRNVKGSAKHEALHLLVSRLEHNGRHRYISDDEMYEATEELVHKLEDLIP